MKNGVFHTPTKVHLFALALFFVWNTTTVFAQKNAGNQHITQESWENDLKPKVINFFEEQIYGKVPNFTPEYTYKVLEEGKTEIYLRRQIEVTAVINKTDTFRMLYLLLLPPGKIKGLLAGLNFDGNHTLFPDRKILLSKAWCNNDVETGVLNYHQEEISRGTDLFRWPILSIMDSGYALATCMYNDWEADETNAWKKGIRAAVARQNGKPLADNEWGAVSVWAYGLNHLAQTSLQFNPELRKLPVYVVGHSRLGKAALWAGIKYPIFKGAFTNNSGCLGSKLNKPMRGELFDKINTKFPHWFAANCKKWNNRDSSLTYDQDLLLATLAPRHLYVTSAEQDTNADPKGEYAAWKSSLSVFGMYLNHPINVPAQPARQKPILNELTGYHFRAGIHNFSYYDWDGFLKALSLWEANHNRQ
jgi:hypothetical protein